MDDKNLIDKLLDDELDDEVKKQIENLKLDITLLNFVILTSHTGPVLSLVFIRV